VRGNMGMEEGEEERRRKKNHMTFPLYINIPSMTGREE